MAFFKNENFMQNLILDQLNCVIKCFDEYSSCFSNINNDTSNNTLVEYSRKIELAESNADEKRHIIVSELLKGNLLLDTRREIKSLIEEVDNIANICEEIMKQIEIQNIRFDDNTKENLILIHNKTKIQLDILLDIINTIFTNFNKSYEDREKIIKIESIESEIDTIEEETIKKIYSSDLSLASKNQLRYFITKIADISDVIEDISDIVEMILVLRKF